MTKSKKQTSSQKDLAKRPRHKAPAAKSRASSLTNTGARSRASFTADSGTKSASKSASKSGANYILAIDQGTTGTTVTLIHRSGHAVATTTQEYQQIYPQPGWVEHRPIDIWKSVENTITKCLKLAKLKGSDIATIGITNQRETVILWDKKSHRAVHNAIVWQDRRTAEQCDEWKKEGLEEMIRAKTGLVIDPYFSASKLKWILDQNPQLRTRAKAGELRAGTVDSYLVSRLTAGRVHATDVSNASRTMLMNLDTGAWDSDLLNLFNVPSLCLPEIRDSNGDFGVTQNLSFLPDGIPINGVAGDQQAALFGQTCFTEGEAKCTFGTGSFLLMNTGTERVPSKSGLLTTAAWRLKNQKGPVGSSERQKITYALEGGAFVCGAAVQFLRDQLGFIKKSEEIESLAKTVQNSGGVEFVPALTGLGAPHWNPYARGMICGLTRGSTRAHIARATLEAMALQNSEILFAMQADLGKSLRSLRVDGGAAANNLLMQLQADYLGCEVIRPKLVATTSLGAAYLAGLGAGLFADLADVKKIWKVDRSFEPKITSHDRHERLEKWKKAVSRTS